MQMKAVKILLGSALLSQGIFAELRLSDLNRQMQQVRIVTPNETCGATTALARPILDECDGCCGNNWWAEIGALYLHPKVAGTEYAYIADSVTSPCGGSNCSPIRYVDFKWDWGLKVGIGYNFQHDGWDSSLRYKWYETGSSSNTTVHATTLQSVIPLKGFPTIGDITDVLTKSSRSHSRFKLKYNVIELELGRDYYVSRHLSTHPHFGLKAGFFTLQQSSKYIGGDIGCNLYSVYDCSKYWGFGPMVGWDNNFHVCRGFSLFANFAASLVYGQFKVNHTETYSIGVNQRPGICTNHHSFIPELEMFFAIQYDRYFWDDMQHFRLRFGFEAEYWFRINQMVKSETITTSGTGAIFQAVERYSFLRTDMSLHGLILEARLDF
ncbi:MAG: Lpg1974 family pore-forming outer membrane protein [Chlamydiales bacterium]